MARRDAAKQAQVIKTAATELRHAWEHAESAEQLVASTTDIIVQAKQNYGPAAWEKDGAEAAIFHMAKQPVGAQRAA